ncbi:hypothetical protein A3740_18885 [Oleiphilus sp. HI0068]|nr:hypothetical protein A3740_18885 [Oleiphilus sp. HI0068]KZY81206.1 hypothetical protein A3741_17595 [Oleiphilus sp. HI0069]KZZ45649.1 hypothetical protein A3755_19745 [Oleiphilus sp. HI0085]KZZ76109.1 hypothetical protein A3766_14920 [Oleiphilus sp. HI0132]
MEYFYIGLFGFTQGVFSWAVLGDSFLPSLKRPLAALILGLSMVILLTIFLAFSSDFHDNVFHHWITYLITVVISSSLASVFMFRNNSNVISST